jgi:hypothetical protein
MLLLPTLFALVLGLVLFYRYLGGFAPVRILQRQLEPFVILVRDAIGPYKDCGPVFAETKKLIADSGILGTHDIRHLDTVGVYYSDPRVVPAAECRYAVGIEMPADRAHLIPTIKQLGFRAVRSPSQVGIAITHPYRHPLSMLVGLRVYRPLRRWLSACSDTLTTPHGPIFEFYRHSLRVIEYVTAIETEDL